MEGINKLVKDKNLDILRCPDCLGVLVQGDGEFVCVSGGHGHFKSVGDKMFFIDSSNLKFYEKEHGSGINKLKSFFKKYPRLYYFLWHIFCPVSLNGKRPVAVLDLLDDKKSNLILNLGSGPRRLHKDFINLDVVPFPEVDIIADVSALPFADNSFDAVVSESLLEHVTDPIKVVSEMRRVLRSGGILYASIPFLTPFHASPDDFNRWTKNGLHHLFSGFDLVDEGVDGGPWSALLVFLAYWGGTVFSFGVERLSSWLAFGFMIILGPLKIFDWVFSRLPGAHAVAAQLYFIGKKNG